ncbi:MAG: PEGA domain-containing protein [Prevotella sp.]|nr:PEGA domain-containing protein [Prevotella sp.]
MDSSERMGYLSVQSTPSSAMIWIDQENRGKTPLKVSLREGEHRVYISKDGLSTAQSVYVRRNETSFVTAYLDGGKSQQVHSTGKIFGQSNHDRSGIIDIQCVPIRASVRIDDHYSGMTPMKVSVAEGVHKVYLSNAGISQSYSVNVRRGEIAYIKGNLRGNRKASQTTSTTNNSSSSDNTGCFWLTIIAIICAMIIGWWIYSRYYGGSIPFVNNHQITTVVDSVEVDDLLEINTLEVDNFIEIDTTKMY